MAHVNAPPALLLVGHGTHSQRGTAGFLKLAELVASRLSASEILVEPAFLEIAEPTISVGLNRLARRGAKQIVVVPLLLFAAGHAKRDIPEAVRAAWEKIFGDCGEATPHPQPHSHKGRGEIEQAEHLGCDPLLLELSSRRFTEALQARETVPAEETCLLLVGRGSRDAAAMAEMHEFAKLRGAGRLPHVEVAFLAMAEPSVADSLARLTQSSFRRIVVQPHLLFQGELFENLQTLVRTTAARNPQQEWLLTPLLADDIGQGGPADGLLVRLVCERYHSVGIRIVASSGRG